MSTHIGFIPPVPPDVVGTSSVLPLLSLVLVIATVAGAYVIGRRAGARIPRDHRSGRTEH